MLYDAKKIAHHDGGTEEMNKEAIHSACRVLRERLGLNQVEMGNLLGRKGANTFSLWERSVVPSQEALARLVNLAAKRGYHDLASVFREALAELTDPELLDAFEYVPQKHEAQAKVRTIGSVSVSTSRKNAALLGYVSDILENPIDAIEESLAAYLRLTLERQMTERLNRREAQTTGK